jgi:hypothetical protein
MADIDGDAWVKLLLPPNASGMRWYLGAFEWAAAAGHLDTLKRLVSSGAQEENALEWCVAPAIENGHIEIINYLAECGIDVTESINFNRAVASGRVHVVNHLVLLGANPKSFTSYMVALREGQGDVARRLVELGSRPMREAIVYLLLLILCVLGWSYSTETYEKLALFSFFMALIGKFFG